MLVSLSLGRIERIGTVRKGGICFLGVVIERTCLLLLLEKTCRLSCVEDARVGKFVWHTFLEGWVLDVVEAFCEPCAANSSQSRLDKGRNTFPRRKPAYCMMTHLRPSTFLATHLHDL